MNEPSKIILIGDAAADARSKVQREKMESFFAGLSGREKRRLRMAARRITGKTETIAQMTARLARPKP